MSILQTLRLVGSNGLRQESVALAFLEQIAAAGTGVRPIVMSEDMSREDVVSFFRNGARGLVCKLHTDVSVLLKCICCVGAGQVWANSDQLEQLLRSLSHPRSLKVTNTLGDSLLSQREEQVLHLLADGLSNRDLAKTLKLSEHTVKNRLFRIFDKLGVSNRMEAVLYAISQREQRLAPSRAASSFEAQTGAAKVEHPIHHFRMRGPLWYGGAAPQPEAIVMAAGKLRGFLFRFRGRRGSPPPPHAYPRREPALSPPP